MDLGHARRTKLLSLSIAKTTVMHLTHEAIENHLASLTKPPGSLGKLEELAAQICMVQQTLRPQVDQKEAVVFAADHGVVNSGVSAWPSSVTAAMIQNVESGGAACCAFARAAGIPLSLVDVGSVGGPSAPGEHVRAHWVRGGTRDLAIECALTVEEWERAVEIGRAEAIRTIDSGAQVLIAGEIGIGNTTSTACLAALLCDLPAESVVGRGAGADDETLARKLSVVRTAVERARHFDEFPKAVAALGGLEIAAMTGFYLEGARQERVIILDGAISSVAALLAEKSNPGSAKNMIASHRSVEPSHEAVLEALQLDPLLDLRLRLGEGTGALLAAPMLDAAAAMVSEMATFDQVKIPTPDSASPTELAQ